MTNSPQTATAAASADAPADEESLYRATMQALDAPAKETSMLRKAVLLISTLALSVVAFLWLGFSLLFLLILIGVLLFHELGHYLGMRLFGYRDVSMFFIPFLGAAVSGRKYAAPVWQEATMLLLGPLPGLALAMALNWYYEPGTGTELYMLVLVLTYVNAFNLLPVMPLDGGRLVNLLFFARQPYLAAGFQLLAGCALVAYAWLNTSWVLGFLGGLMLLGVSHTYGEARQGEQLRAEGLELPDEIERLSDAQRRLLFARAVPRVAQVQRNPASLAAQVRAVYEHMMARRPSLLTIVLFMALYLSGFAAYAFVAYGGTPLSAANAADNRGLSASLRGKPDEALAEYRKALAIREAYATRYPDSLEGQYALTLSYENLALESSGAGAPAQRLDYLEKVLTIRRKAVELDPTSARWQYELSRAHKSLADYYVAGPNGFNRREQALAHVNKAITYQEAAIAKDWRSRLGEWWSYGSRVGRSDLSELRRDAGWLSMHCGQPGEAVKHYRTALSLEEKMARSNRLGTTHDGLGGALAATGHRAEAVEHLREAIARYQQEIAAGGRSVGLTQLSLDRVLHTLAPLLLELGRESEALDVYRMALLGNEKRVSDAERKEARENGGKPGADTAFALERVSRGALLARDFAKALAVAERSLSMFPQYRRTHAYRAHALLLLGRTDEAKAAYIAHRGLLAEHKLTWEQAVSADFAMLRRAGLTHPMMAEIQKLLGIGGQQ